MSHLFYFFLIFKQMIRKIKNNTIFILWRQQNSKHEFNRTTNSRTTTKEPFFIVKLFYS